MYKFYRKLHINILQKRVKNKSLSAKFAMDAIYIFSNFTYIYKLQIIQTQFGQIKFSP